MSVYIRLSFFHDHVLIMFVHFPMNISTLRLNQEVLNNGQTRLIPEFQKC